MRSSSSFIIYTGFQDVVDCLICLVNIFPSVGSCSELVVYFECSCTYSLNLSRSSAFSILHVSSYIRWHFLAGRPCVYSKSIDGGCWRCFRVPLLSPEPLSREIRLQESMHPLRRHRNKQTRVLVGISVSSFSKPFILSPGSFLCGQARSHRVSRGKLLSSSRNMPQHIYCFWVT